MSLLCHFPFGFRVRSLCATLVYVCVCVRVCVGNRGQSGRECSALQPRTSRFQTPQTEESVRAHQSRVNTFKPTDGRFNVCVPDLFKHPVSHSVTCSIMITVIRTVGHLRSFEVSASGTVLRLEILQCVKWARRGQ